MAYALSQRLARAEYGERRAKGSSRSSVSAVRSWASNAFKNSWLTEDAMGEAPTKSPQPPEPPRGVALSGAIFPVLYIVSVVLVRLAVPADPTDVGVWLEDPELRNWVRIAVNLVPFTGLAFLWFMATLRNRIGLLEDRFFATVFSVANLVRGHVVRCRFRHPELAR